MARVTLDSGESITVGGITEVYGTAGAQSVTVLDGSSITFRSGFNSGSEDDVRLTGKASDFVISRTGSTVTLFSAVDNITITIPVGAKVTNIIFDNGDSRELRIDGGDYKLGDQLIGTSAAAVEPGPGVFLISGPTLSSEGDVAIFTVTRTDTNGAAVLNYSVNGSTNGGSVQAATPGVDYNLALNPDPSTISFADGVATAQIKVFLNSDNNVEPVEGYTVQVLDGLDVLAETTSAILDTNQVGQTFVLTAAIDRVGTGHPLDLIGSEGSTNTNGQDRIVGTQNTINVFDNLNGGAERDSFDVLDDGAAFTNAPVFTNVTVSNVEEFNYTSVRGLAAGAINTTAWTGLEDINISVNANSAQTLTSATTTLNTVFTNAGIGSVNLINGGGVLTVNANDPGDVNVGQAGGANAYTAITVNGGDDIAITDTGVGQELTTVVLDGFDDDASISGSALTDVTIQNIVGNGEGGSRLVNITAPNPTVDLNNFAVTNLDVTFSNSFTLNVSGTATGLRDISTGGSGASGTLNWNGGGTLFFDDINVTNNNLDGAGTVTINAVGGSVSFDDINGDVGNNNLQTVNLNATGGNITLDDIFGKTTVPTTSLAVNITGSGNVFFDTVSGTVITATGSGAVTIGDVTSYPYRDALSTTTQFNGSGDTGSDTMTFAAGNTQANTFGGGDDQVSLLGANGLGGSWNAGTGYDTLAFESNFGETFTGSATPTSNFDQVWITHQVLGTWDTVNLANIGFEGSTTDVISGLTPAANVVEVVTVSLTGAASWADQVTFEGETVTFADGATGAALSAAFVAQTGGSTTNWSIVDNFDGTITLTSLNPGVVTDLTAGDFVFTDSTTIGKPSLESNVTNPNNLDNGAVPVAAAFEVATLTLTSVTVLNGQTITIEYDGSDGPDSTFTFTNTTGDSLTQEGGTLADLIVAAANGDADFSTDFVATRVGNNVVFTANVADDDGELIFSGSNTGLTVGLDDFALTTNTQGQNFFAGDDEDALFILDGVASGNDQLIFDGVTITFTDGADPATQKAQFLAQYNAAIGRTYNASTPGLTYDGGLTFFPVSAALPGAIHLSSVNPTNLPNLSAGDFVFVDDNNVGTPGVSISIDTQGSSSVLELNNFRSGSELRLDGLGGTHIVNLLDTNGGAADSIEVILNATGDHGSLTAQGFETVSIDTSNPPAGGTDTLFFADSALQALTVTGSDDLVLDTTSTVIATLNASGLNGHLTWSADANSVPIVVSTGSGGSLIDFSAITIAGLAPITFNGGSGADDVALGGIGTARALLTLGGGNDIVHVAVVDGGNDYSTITDFNVGTLLNHDTIDLAAGSYVGLDQVLEPTATFQDYLDQAASDLINPVGSIHSFHWDIAGVTYTFVVQNNGGGEDFQDGVDSVIALQGNLNLQSYNFA